MISELTHGGAIPVLERTVAFTSARHKVITDNVANLSTPFYKPKELDPAQFQAQLREAVERRRSESGSDGQPLRMADSEQLEFENGRMNPRPQRANENIMFHDKNNRNLEQEMQDLAENTMMHRASVRLLKNEFDLINTAIRERV